MIEHFNKTTDQTKNHIKVFFSVKTSIIEQDTCRLLKCPYNKLSHISILMNIDVKVSSIKYNNKKLWNY